MSRQRYLRSTLKQLLGLPDTSTDVDILERVSELKSVAETVEQLFERSRARERQQRESSE
jgi:hypothetical protein